MGIRKIAILFCMVIIFCWVGEAFSESNICSIVEGILGGLFALVLAFAIIRDTKKSNKQKRACSKLVEQIGFVFPPDFTCDKPFQKTGWACYLFGIIGVVMLLAAIMEIVD